MIWALIAIPLLPLVLVAFALWVLDKRVKIIPGYRCTLHILGGLKVHKYFRGDNDTNPHDHPWDFYTFPLTGYVEEVLDENGILQVNLVKPWRLHYRPAEYIHRLVGREDLDGPWLTVVWECRNRRNWGFWVPHEDAVYVDHLRKHDPLYRWPANPMYYIADRKFIPWRTYLGLEP